MGREVGVDIKKAFESVEKGLTPDIPTKGNGIDLEKAIGFNTQEHSALRNTVQMAIFDPDETMRKTNTQMLELLGVTDAYPKENEVYITLRHKNNDVLAYLCQVYPEYSDSTPHHFKQPST